MLIEEKIRLPVLLEGKRHGTEVLDAEKLGEGRYRLIHSPGFVDSLAAGDEFEIDPDATCGFRILKHGGNLVVWVIYEEGGRVFEAVAQELQKQVEHLGGRLDGGSGSTLVFTIPVDAGFPAVEKVFNDFVARNHDVSWMYGNVYDEQDRPLGWWK
jgi:hypothetical protein